MSCTRTPSHSRPTPAGSRRSRSGSSCSARLKRKHGGSIADVLEHAERCRAEHARLVDADETTSRAGAASWQRTADELERLAAELRAAREQAAARARGRRARRAREPGDGRAVLRGRARRSRRARATASTGSARTGADAVEFLIAPNPRRPAGPSARDRVRRRALARDARADERRDRGRRSGHGRVRRGRRGRRRATPRARSARGSSDARASAAGRLHHPPAAGRVAGRAPFPRRRRTATAPARSRVPRSSSSSSASSWRSFAGCSARTRTTARPGDMPNACSKPRRIPQSASGRAPRAIPNPGRPHADWPAATSACGRSLLLPEISGTARLGKRTKDLVKRLGAGDIAIIDHRDIDRMAAEDLVESGVQGGRQRRPVDHRPLSEPRAADPHARRASGSSTRRAPPLFEKLKDGDDVDASRRHA